MTTSRRTGCSEMAYRATLPMKNCTMWFQMRWWTAPSLAGSAVGRSSGRVHWAIVDPTDGAKELLNSKIKRRESFRPFAPSILSEHVAEWFELDEPVPFMEKVFPIRPWPSCPARRPWDAGHLQRS